MLSSVRKLLVNSRLMIKSLENAEDLLAALQPEIIDLCLSPQDGEQPEKLPSGTGKAITPREEAAIATPPKKWRHPLETPLLTIR